MSPKPDEKSAANPPSLVGTPPVEAGPKVEPAPVADLLLMRVEVMSDAAVAAAQEIAKATGKPVVLLVGKTRLDALDEQTMAKYGWVRADATPAPTELVQVVSP